ncbi:MAG: prepilin-type N-terminal cleavage/methylation domain-containing protein [Candidatus Roizmanbacteria bacterium]
MFSSYLRSRSRGYSLVEVLVVLGIIAILVTIILVATNPSRQFGLADDAKRKKDVSEVLGAVDRHLLDAKGTLPGNLAEASVPRRITNSVASPTNVDLCFLVTEGYLPKLPRDPSLGADITNCLAAYDTGYYIVFHPDGIHHGVWAPQSTADIVYAGVVDTRYLVTGPVPTALVTLANTPTPSQTPTPSLTPTLTLTPSLTPTPSNTPTPTPIVLASSVIGTTYIGSGGVQSTLGNIGLNGIIGTDRVSPIGIFVFTANTNYTGASNSTHVDGYVRKYGLGPFTLPVGDNGVYRPVTIGGMSLSTDSVTAAYYNANPTTAITSRIDVGSFPALPSGAPFSSVLFDSTLSRVSTTEYWDIDGSTITTINLPWGAASGISTLTDATISKLTIVGWNGVQWVALPSSVVSGSTLTTGSITTIQAIIPSTYNVYTFGKVP